MKNLRIRKQNRAVRVIKNGTVHGSPMDKGIFDVVLKALYMDEKNEMDLENDILRTSRIKVTAKESKHLWNILTSSGWIMPSVGFGKAGKIELTKAGFQLMAQYGGYKEYLRSVEDSQKPQTIIMPIAIETEGDKGHIVELPQPDKK